MPKTNYSEASNTATETLSKEAILRQFSVVVPAFWLQIKLTCFSVHPICSASHFWDFPAFKSSSLSVFRYDSAMYATSVLPHESTIKQAQFFTYQVNMITALVMKSKQKVKIFTNKVNYLTRMIVYLSLQNQNFIKK